MKARKHTHTMTVEIEVEVAYTVDGESRPAVTHGPADNWRPPEEIEVELDEVLITMVGRDGVRRSVDILPVLPKDVEQGIMDEVYDAACEAEAGAYEDAMERAAEARADERSDR